ncbi:hypothetical protein [Streptosporangium roseum]|uniref:hypothetical protein n=1 Tax=Streptosporangium roseum TaxID=2001 RepID=UPI00343099BD
MSASDPGTRQEKPVKNSAKKNPGELRRLAEESQAAAAAASGAKKDAHARVAAELERMAQEQQTEQ